MSGSPTNAAGSPKSGEPAYLAIGFLRRPHGVRGEMLMDVLTDFPERIQPKVQVYVGEEHRPMKIASRRETSKGMLISFEGIRVREEVGAFRNQYLYVLAADRPPLPEGEYYHHQLVGLRVLEENGAELGVLESVLETGANDVYIVRSAAGKEILLPAIPSVVKSVHLESGEMRVHLLPGLLDES